MGPEYDVIAYQILSRNADPNDFMGREQLYAVAVMVKGQVDDYAVYLAITRQNEHGVVGVDELQRPLQDCSKLPREIGEFYYGDVAEKMGLTWRD